MKLENIKNQIIDLHNILYDFDQNGILTELKEKYTDVNDVNNCEYHLYKLLEYLTILTEVIEIIKDN
jgi:hypothetical protein